MDAWTAFDPTAVALACLRIAAFFGVAPVFGHSSVPPRIRIALAVGVALVVHPARAQELAVELPGSALAIVVVEELAIGLALGFAMRLIFTGVGLIGEVIGLQGGLGAAIALDPTSDATSGALAGLLRATAFLVFLAIEGHHAMIQVVARSYVLLPLGGQELSTLQFLDLFGLGASMFELGARLAAPIMVAMFCSNIGVGILGRAIPQLNLITVQLPALVGVTFLLIGLSAGELTHWLELALAAWPERVLRTLVGEG